MNRVKNNLILRAVALLLVALTCGAFITACVYSDRTAKELSFEQLSEMLVPNVVAVETNTGKGSAVIMDFDEQGRPIFLTNYHVVKRDLLSIVVVDSSGNKVPCSVGKFNEAVDLAMLRPSTDFVTSARKLVGAKIPNTELNFIGDILAVRKGQEVLAIGNALGYGIAVCNGIVAKETAQAGSIKAIHITAPINGGNSGGGLFNRYGQLIGINFAQIASTDDDNDPGTPSRPVDGFSYAIAIDVVMDFYNLF